MSLEPFSIDTVKGWTRISCVAFIALAVSELDVTEDRTKALLEPLHRVLDRAWLIPMLASEFDFAIFSMVNHHDKIHTNRYHIVHYINRLNIIYCT